MVKRRHRPILTVRRGLPGSGKTTWAREWLDYMAAQGRRGTLVRVNRDDLRSMLFDAGYRIPEASVEEVVTVAQHVMVRALLDVGVNVIVDDTNLHPEHLNALRGVARCRCAACFAVRDFTDVPLRTCLARDAQRHRPVGAEVITDMWQRHLASKEDPA